MILIGVHQSETELALAALRAIPGMAKIVGIGLKKVMELAATHRPSVIVVSVKCGGSEERTVEHVRQLSSTGGGLVILLSHGPTMSEFIEARDLGAFAVIDADGGSLRRDLRKAISACASLSRRSSEGRRSMACH